jgi:hypothetical protein
MSECLCKTVMLEEIRKREMLIMKAAYTIYAWPAAAMPNKQCNIMSDCISSHMI